MLRWIASGALIAIVLSAVPCWARSTTLVGGVTSAAYVYSGNQHESIFYEGANHDARFQLAGLLGYEHTRAQYDFAVGLFAGALVSARSDNFRTVLVRMNAIERWRATRTVELGGSFGLDLEPLSTSQITAAGSTQSIGRQTLWLRPAIDADFTLGRNDRLTVALRGQLFYLLVDLDTLQDEEIDAAGSAQVHIEWEHTLWRNRSLRARTLTRVMKGRAVIDPPTTALVGGMVGATARWERLVLRGMAGIGRIVNLAPSHLWPVEPLLEADLVFNGRVDTLGIDAAWTVRENVYVGGLPERAIRARLSWSRAPSWRRWRGMAEAVYEYTRYTAMNTAASVRRADRLQVIRLRGRVYYTVLGAWRLFGEVTTNFGWRALEQPSCDARGCPDSGVFASTMLGLAYIAVDRPRDERLIDDVW
jgi:hypothetical protein